jgi:serine/threonine-protein kinase
MQASANTTELDRSPYQLSKPDCLGALNAGQYSVYAGSGSTAEIGNRLDEAPNSTHQVIQVVVAFPVGDQAGTFVTNSASKWKTCAGQAVTQSLNGEQRRYTFGPLVGQAPKVTQMVTAESGSMCQRALSAISNVVIDVTACGYRLTDEAGRIADAIAANVTK